MISYEVTTQYLLLCIIQGIAFQLLNTENLRLPLEYWQMKSALLIKSCQSSIENF